MKITIDIPDKLALVVLEILNSPVDNDDDGRTDAFIMEKMRESKNFADNEIVPRFVEATNIANSFAHQIEEKLREIKSS